MSRGRRCDKRLVCISEFDCFQRRRVAGFWKFRGLGLGLLDCFIRLRFWGCLGSNFGEHIQEGDVTPHEQVLSVQVFAYGVQG